MSYKPAIQAIQGQVSRTKVCASESIELECSGNMRRKHSCQWARKYFIYPTQKWPLETFSGTITQLGAETGLRGPDQDSSLWFIVKYWEHKKSGVCSDTEPSAISQSHT